MKCSRTWPRIAGALSAVLWLVMGGAAPAADRPNLVLIVTDNQSPSLLGTYGNRDILTPHIDRLAQEGIQFEEAFAASGVCSPTRATLLTGLMPSQTGVHNALPTEAMRTAAARLMPGDWSAIQEFRNLPQTLKDAGYRTGLVGKFHLGTHATPQLGFDYWVTFPHGHTMRFYGETIIDNGRTYVEEGHMTELWTRKAKEFLSQQDSQTPFFLLLTYNGPYMLPPSVLRDPKNRFGDYYRANVPAMPQEAAHPYLLRYAYESEMSELFMRVGIGGWPALMALNNKTAMINLASEMSMVDAGVGEVMAALKEYGFDDNTLVVFTSDQGSSYGQHGLWGNTSWSYPFTAYNEHMKVPLIVRHTGKIAAGQRVKAFINQFDVFPTLLDYLGLGDRTIADTPGRSFAPLLKGEALEGWEDAAFFEYITIRVIETPKWKYLKAFLIGADELYDLENDPEERVNLAEDPAYADIRQQLERRLTAFFDQYTDPKYDPWKGGTAKLRLLDSGRNAIFAEHFENWSPPVPGDDSFTFRDPSP